MNTAWRIITSGRRARNTGEGQMPSVITDAAMNTPKPAAMFTML